jgi:hypothetical protein
MSSAAQPFRYPEAVVWLVLLVLGQAAGWTLIVQTRLSPDVVIPLVCGLACAGAIAFLVLTARIPLLLKTPLWLVSYLGIVGLMALTHERATAEFIFIQSLAIASPVVALEPALWVIRILSGYEFRWRSAAENKPRPDDASTAQAPAAGESQFRVWHLFALTAVVAVFLGACRLFLPEELLNGSDRTLHALLLVTLILVPAAAGCLLLAITILLPDLHQAPLYSIPLSVGLLVGLTAYHLLVSWLSRLPAGWELFLFLNGAIVIFTAASLVMLRLAGYVFGPPPRTD